MPYIKPEIAERIKNTAESHLVDIIGKFVTLTPKNGKFIAAECPVCKAAKKFSVDPAKGAYGCFHCRPAADGRSAIGFLMKQQGMTMPDALRWVAQEYGIDLEEEKKPKPSKKKGTFCERMLADSGLTKADIMASVMKRDGEKSIFQLAPIHPGTIDDHGNIVDGDDAIIEYYDLEGLPVMYERKDQNRKGTGKMMCYYRVRWQYPDAHKDKEGKSFKYKSPYGSGTPIYIPQFIRSAYGKKEEIETLFIQEGEKKSEAACKYGLPSIAVSGIQNIGYNNALPEDIIKIIRDCKVKNVVFLFDSDWQDLSHDLKLTENVQKRPYNFFCAARNFRDYMRNLKNLDIFVEQYIGHTNGTNGDKGIDDLLAHTLKGHEDDLKNDIATLMNTKQLTGTYCQFYKVTAYNDHQLQMLWGLDNPTDFMDLHKDVLKGLPEFLVGKYKYRYNAETDKFESAQPFDDDEQFWEEVESVDRNGNTKTSYNYSYVNATNFLQRHGFGRFLRGNGSFTYIHMERPFVENIDHINARDYIVQFAKVNCGKPVLEMLYKGIVQYCGPDKMSLLDYIEPRFLHPDRDKQYLYFSNFCWKVTSNKVEQIPYASLDHDVWKDRLRETPASYVGSLIHFEVDSDTGKTTYKLTAEGHKCHFLQFLINASNFSWRKEPKDVDDQELDENNKHLLSKMCAIGYLCMDVKDPNVSRAVIAMDGKDGEIGQSNGRSGKSLVGELLRHVTTLAYIPGKKRDLMNDQFLWNDVNEKTRVVFIDDVLQNFDFESLFPLITGDWTVNYKGGIRITYPYATSPKIYIPTNHTISGEGSSFRDRQWVIAFSDFYNDTHKPTDDFGQLFFHEWDYEQWNLTWCLIANCIQLYLRYGVVQAPGDRTERRQLRNEATENMISWLSEYYSDPERIGVAIKRNDLMGAYFDYDPMARKNNMSPNTFKKRYKKALEYLGWQYNPNLFDSVTGNPCRYDADGKPVIDDKRGGVEYFTINKPDDGEEDPNALF